MRLRNKLWSRKNREDHQVHKRLKFKCLAANFSVAILLSFLLSSQETISVQAEDELLPNEAASVMIIMYHGLSPEKIKSPYDRSIDNFKQDLQTFYALKYRLISLTDLMKNDIKVPRGYSPLVLTFDDGLSTAFSLVNDNGKLVPQKDCAVDILNRFYEEHPDFGKEAVFYVNGYKEPFQGDGTLEERFAYLQEQGFELGNHTYDHVRLGKQNADSVLYQIGKLDKFIKESYGGSLMSLAYPYGERPSSELRPLALQGSYEGHAYEYICALREGQSGASSNPVSVKFDRLNIPRLRGSDVEATDMGWQLRRNEQYPRERYVSDGDPNKITIPKSLEGLINPEALDGKELLVY